MRRLEGEKNAGIEKTEIGGRERTEIRGQWSGVRGRRTEVVFIFLSGLLIFLYSVVLETIQFFLPYRTFNVYDIVANGIGILGFVVVVLVISGTTGVRLPSEGDMQTLKHRKE